MNLPFWVALLGAILVFLIGFLRQVSLVVLVVRAFLSGLVLYIFTYLLSYGGQQMVIQQQLFEKQPDEVVDENEKKEQISLENTKGLNLVKRRESQIALDLISRLNQDPTRGAELVRKMSLTDKERK